MREVFAAFFRHVSHYDALLPYNLNWKAVDWGAAGRFLTENSFCVYDIGARGGGLGELDHLERFIHYYGFEADASEALSVEETTRHRFAASRIFPYFVGNVNGKQKFHLFKDLGNSSSLRPNPTYVEDYMNPGFDIAKTVEIDSLTLDTIVEREGLEEPDFLKLDTQGSELSILKAAPQTLTSSLLVEVEVEFHTLYVGQPLFHDVARHMFECGFDLLYLNRVFAAQREFKGPARGQILFGDALFGRSPRLCRLSPVRAAKYALLLINYGHLDLAFDLVKRNPAIRDLVPAIDRFFRHHFHPRSRIVRAASMQLDKLIAFLLWVRGTNQRHCDSDRSWPIR